MRVPHLSFLKLQIQGFIKALVVSNSVCILVFWIGRAVCSKLHHFHEGQKCVLCSVGLFWFNIHLNRAFNFHYNSCCSRVSSLAVSYVQGGRLAGWLSFKISLCLGKDLETTVCLP